MLEILGHILKKRAENWATIMNDALVFLLGQIRELQSSADAREELHVSNVLRLA